MTIGTMPEVTVASTAIGHAAEVDTGWDASLNPVKTVTRTLLEDERHMGAEWRKRLLELGQQLRANRDGYEVNATTWRQRAAKYRQEGCLYQADQADQSASFNDGLVQGLRIAIQGLEYNGVQVR